MILVLCGISCIHIGLVVTANLYTRVTKVENGVLMPDIQMETFDDVKEGNRPPVPIGTATASSTFDLDYLMNRMSFDDQLKNLQGSKHVIQNRHICPLDNDGVDSESPYLPTRQ